MLYGLAPEPEVHATIRVRMVKDSRAIPCAGAPETVYVAGNDYDLPDWLAEAYFRDGIADPAEAHMQAENAAQEPQRAPVAAEGASGGAKTRRGAPRAKIGASTGV